MSVGIHSGTVHLFLVGDLHRELLVAGPAATLTAAMEKAANQGQIMVSPATADALPRGSTGPRVGPGHLLRWRQARVAPVGAVLPRQVPPDSAVHFLPARLRDALAGAVEPEHRIASVGFMRFEGTDDVLAHGGPDALAADLDEAMRDRPRRDGPRGRDVPRERPRQQRLQGAADDGRSRRPGRRRGPARAGHAGGARRPAAAHPPGGGQPRPRVRRRGRHRVPQHLHGDGRHGEPGRPSDGSRAAR